MGQSGRVRRCGRDWGARREGAEGTVGGAVALTALLSPPQSRHQKRARAQAQLRNLEAYAAQPHSFVFARGRAGRGVRQLSLDLRRVMEPLTATRLQVCVTRRASVSHGPCLGGRGVAPVSLARERDPYGEQRPCGSGICGAAARARADERTPLGAWLHA